MIPTASVTLSAASINGENYVKVTGAAGPSLSKLGVMLNTAYPLEVGGSAASGTRRGVGTNLPIGKGAGTRSDIDYITPPS